MRDTYWNHGDEEGEGEREKKGERSAHLGHGQSLPQIQGPDPLIQPRTIIEYMVLDLRSDGLVALGANHHRSGGQEVEGMHGQIPEGRSITMNHA